MIIMALGTPPANRTQASFKCALYSLQGLWGIKSLMTLYRSPSTALSANVRIFGWGFRVCGISPLLSVADAAKQRRRQGNTAKSLIESK